jgi:hypothetical protein
MVNQSEGAVKELIDIIIKHVLLFLNLFLLQSDVFNLDQIYLFQKIKHQLTPIEHSLISIVSIRL